MWRRSSTHHNGVGGSIIDLTRPESEEELAPELEDHTPEQEELAWMHEEDLEKQMVVEESITSAQMWGRS
jgi:hypothetical protein